MTEQLKAEAFVREERLHLAFDGMMRCDTCMVSYQSKEHIHGNECGGKPRKLNKLKDLNLQDWVGVLGEVKLFCSNGYLSVLNDDNYRYHIVLSFNLTTGQPATEADFKAFNDIVSV